MNVLHLKRKENKTITLEDMESVCLWLCILPLCLGHVSSQFNIRTAQTEPPRCYNSLCLCSWHQLFSNMKHVIINGRLDNCENWLSDLLPAIQQGRNFLTQFYLTWAVFLWPEQCKRLPKNVISTEMKLENICTPLLSVTVASLHLWNYSKYSHKTNSDTQNSTPPHLLLASVGQEIDWLDWVSTMTITHKQLGPYFSLLEVSLWDISSKKEPCFISFTWFIQCKLCIVLIFIQRGIFSLDIQSACFWI